MGGFKFSSLLLAVLFPALAFGFEGSVRFTEAEKADHEKGQDVILQEAAKCLHDQFNFHTAFYKKYGISPYYGEGSDFGQDKEKKKMKRLAKLGFGAEVRAQMKPTSCVGQALTCLGQGFKAAGQAAYWQRIRQYTIDNNVSGVALLDGLRALGWKVLYWNPDLRLNQQRSEFEERRSRRNYDRYWGYHDQYWATVSRQNSYLGVRVDDFRLLLNFGTETPKTLVGTPYFVGIAHGGYHVFSGSKGEVLEAHSLVDISNPNTLAKSPFNPRKGQGPGHGLYHSGLIAVPAKYAR